MTKDTRKLVGQCLCGAVHYQVEDAFQYALNCHCSQCRRATGSAFKPFGGIPIAKLHVTKGADAMQFYGGTGTEPHDVHCRHCGSLLWSVVREGAYAHVTYGTLMDTPSLLPQAHIMVGSKADWDQILDDLPQHQEWG